MGLFVLPQQYVRNDSGQPLSNAKLFFYETLTTTPKSIYADVNLNTPHTNPVISDAFGVFPAIWLDIDAGNYTVTLTDANDVGQWTVDDVGEIGITQTLVAAFIHPQTAAETFAGVTVANYLYQEMDIRRYGATGNYDPLTEINGQVPVQATDSLPALETAVSVAVAKGGGIIRVCGGDYYTSNSIVATGISNLWLYVEPGSTLRTTKYTSNGTVISLGTATVGTPMSNCGVYGGGTIRSFRPDHLTLTPFDTVIDNFYSVGDYTLSTDSNGEARAYYCKTAGNSDHNNPPTAVNGSSTSGFAVFQDADNDNLISISAIGAYVLDMDLPEASGKPITVQRPGWKDVWIVRNHIGSTNDRGIEIKGQQGSAGQENYFGDGANVIENVIDATGREGIEFEQSSFGVNKNRNCRSIGNLVRSAGIINGAAGIRANRCINFETRGDRVLESGGPGFHIRQCENVIGDVHSENSGASGMHLQQNTGYVFDSIYVKNATTVGVNENTNTDGGTVKRLVIDGATDGWDETGRIGQLPVIVDYAMANLSGANFVGDMPIILAPETGSWTPVLTFATPGDLSVVYSAQSGQYVKRGKELFAQFLITTSTFTHTTASGDLRITGLPVSGAVATWNGPVRWGGITKANYTQVTSIVQSGTTYMEFSASGSAQAVSSVTASNMPTTGTVFLQGTTNYRQTL